jgi:cytochrome P450
MDVIHDVGAPLPVIVIAQLLGIPVADRERFKRWSDDLMLIADGSLALAGFPQAERSTGELREYLNQIFAQRRAAPRDDLISGLLAARERGDRLSDDELFSTCVLLLIAGHETTTNLIGNGLLALLHHPDQLERLRAEPALIRSAIEELLRYDSPVQLTSRIAAVDLVIGGKSISRGQEVSLALGAANRDPAQFADPDRLDIARPDNHHVAFGHGLHFCLGAPLARLEGEIAIHTMVRRFPAMHLATEALSWRPGVMLRGLDALPVAW